MCICVFLTAIDKESDFSGIAKLKLTPESIPIYPDTTGMPEHEVSMMNVKLERETKEIRREFSRLLLKVQKSLERTTALDKLVTLLKEMDDEGWLDKCSSMAQVFHNHKKFCSYYETGMIKVLIEELGTDEDKIAYRDYKKKFQTYSRNRVFKFPSGSYSDEDTSEEVGMKMDKNLEKLGMRQQKEVEFEMNRVFKNTGPIRLLSDEQIHYPGGSGQESVSSVLSGSQVTSSNKATTFSAVNETDDFSISSSIIRHTADLSNETSLLTPSKTAVLKIPSQEADTNVGELSVITMSSEKTQTHENGSALSQIINDSKENGTSIAQTNDKFKVSVTQNSLYSLGLKSLDCQSLSSFPI